jgi:nitrogen fixation protein FixH
MLYEPAMSPILPVSQARPRRLTGWMVLGIFVAFFGVVAGVNAIMIHAALSTFPGSEVKNSYVASQVFNKEIAAMRLQGERNWRVDVVLNRLAGNAALDVTIRDAGGSALRGLVLESRLVHPVDARVDHAAQVRETQPGLYVADFGAVLPGAWNLVIEARRDGERMYVSRSRIVIQK